MDEVVTPPTPETYPDGSPIKKGAQSTEFWPTEAKALEIAKGRTKGARRACKVVAPDKSVRYCTTTHPHYLGDYILMTELGYEISEIGKPTKTSAPVSATSILAAIAALPESERAAVEAQMKALLGS
jgi:hypothetical protein